MLAPSREAFGAVDMIASSELALVQPAPLWRCPLPDISVHLVVGGKSGIKTLRVPVRGGQGERAALSMP